jgi:hypothetical protein
MAGIAPFDMLREGGNLLPDLEAELQQRRLDLGGRDPTLALQAPGINPADITPARAMNLVNAGFVDDGQGRLRDPMRDIALSREASYQMALEHDKDQREKIADSMLFKVGDTLADAGRVFLSPLFWLKGEDQSQYDPSERLKTGYRTQFEGLTTLREANVEKFLNARTSRLQTATNYGLTQRGQEISAMSSSEKELLNYARGNGPEAMAMYNSQDPVQRQQLTNLVNLQQGTSMQYGDRIVTTDTHKLVLDRAKGFNSEVKGYREALDSYSKLVVSLESANGMGDLAAIFQFMKTLDPRSVVRDSEFKAAEGSEGVFKALMNLGDKMMKGNRLTEDGRRAMLDLSRKLVQGYKSGYDAKREARSSEFERYQYAGDEINELLGSSPVIAGDGAVAVDTGADGGTSTDVVFDKTKSYNRHLVQEGE